MRPTKRNGGPTMPPRDRCRSTPISRPSPPSRRSPDPLSTRPPERRARDGTTLAPSPASLRAGRKLDSPRKSARLIDHKAQQIKELDACNKALPAGKRWALLREAAGRLCTGISHRSLLESAIVIRARQGPLELLK